MELIHHVYQGLRAHTLYKRDVEYVVKDGDSHHRGRIYRTPDARTPLVGWLAPGGGKRKKA